MDPKKNHSKVKANQSGKMLILIPCKTFGVTLGRENSQAIRLKNKSYLSRSRLRSLFCSFKCQKAMEPWISNFGREGSQPKMSQADHLAQMKGTESHLLICKGSRPPMWVTSWSLATATPSRPPQKYQITALRNEKFVLLNSRCPENAGQLSDPCLFAPGTPLWLQELNGACVSFHNSLGVNEEHPDWLWG